MTTTVSVEIAPGELIDKITILEIKIDRMSDPEKLENVRLEWQVLTASRDENITVSDELTKITANLKTVNEQLWEIEDDIRDLERDKKFDKKFIDLARAVYMTNDKRAAFKRDINILLGSRLVEEKSYAAY